MMQHSQIYTKTGDSGTTSLYGGKRFSKINLRIETVGSLDELNAALGEAASIIEDRAVVEILQAVQNLLFTVGSEVADVEGKTTNKKVASRHTNNLEQLIDHFDAQLAKLTTFILPGGSRVGAGLHFARAVCRRTERAVVKLSETEKINPEIQRFLNRLGDFLFVLARYVNKLAKQPEVTWTK